MVFNLFSVLFNIGNRLWAMGLFRVGSLAQLAAQETFNLLVEGSSPS